MPKLEIGMLNHKKSTESFIKKSISTRGFTLVEILVVLFIIGITLSFALLAFGDFGSKKRIITAAEQFSNYIKLIQQEAVIESQTFGIIINKNGYQAARLIENNWQAISLHHLKFQTFPKHAKISLSKHTTNHSQPQVIINSTGEMSPFKLKFSSRDTSNIINVIGQSNGSLLLQ